MTRLYFEITDIVEYAKANDHVSGIQRVQVRLIASLARKHGGHQIICTYWNHQTNQYFQIPADELFSTDSFNPKELLVKLRAIKQSWPVDKTDVKKYLNKFNYRGPRRVLKKAEIYLKAIFLKNSLKNFNIKPGDSKRYKASNRVKPIEALPENAILAFLGANWNDPKIMEVGRRHRQSGGQVVQMIYDLIPHTAPEYFNQGLARAFDEFLAGTPDYVTKFTCISDWTASDLQTYIATIPNYQPSIHTTPLAHEFAGHPRNQANQAPSDKTLLTIAKSAGFVLCVGTIEIRKNGANLLRAWLKVIAEHRNPPTLVFAGKFGWKTDEFNSILANNPQLAEYVTLINNPTDQDLAFLYQKCRFNVYPSLYEGWGLPVGEAAWFGKFSLTSSATSLPEVCGDLVDYVDPKDVSSMSQKLIELINHPTYIQEKEKIIRSAPLRTWQSVADDFYSRAIETKHPAHSKIPEDSRRYGN